MRDVRCALLLVLCLAAVARGQGAPPPLPAGWHVTFEQRLGVFQAVAATHAPSAALWLATEESPHPEVRAVGWTATYTATLTPADPGDYRFVVEADGGAASIEILPDAPIAAGRRLPPLAPGRAETAFTPLAGKVRIVVRYQRTGRGAARLRTLWEQKATEFGGFRLEPIPSFVTAIPSELEAEARSGLAALDGRNRLATKGCTQCHDAGPAAVAVATREGPDLSRSAAFLGLDWMALWIRDPAAIREHADMPALLGDAPDADEIALDLAHYVKSLARDHEPPEPDWSFAPELGRTLYHRVGCVACHGPQASPREVFDDPQLPGEIPQPPAIRVRRPFGMLAGKWDRASLATFLADPGVVHLDGRMPSLRLTPSEARAIADYLAFRWNGSDEKPAVTLLDEARAARGATRFGELRCDACHTLEGAAEPASATALTALDALAFDERRGCLDPASTTTPRYSLDDASIAALAAGAAQARLTTGAVVPLDRLRRGLLANECGACHRKDSAFGLDPALTAYFHALDDRVDLGDEGRLPPDLTSVGFKLDSGFVRDILRGDAIARPYMGVRMPAFHALDHAAVAAGFAAEAGIIAGTDVAQPTAFESAVADGRTLIGQNGMNCIGCHSFKDTPPIGSPGPSIDRFASRLRYEWWRAYFPAPARFKPGTRMPSFALGNRSVNATIAGGDIHAQGDAMWSFFELGDAMPAPDGIAAEGEFEILVGEQPVVLRAFLDVAGARAIAVGQPSGLHYAFDAEKVRLAAAWSGEFVDATGAWAGRGGTNLEGMGRVTWIASDAPPLLVGETPAQWPQDSGRSHGYRFRGYVLDAAGQPTFRYDIGGTRVDERIATRLAPRASLVRRFEVEAPAGPIQLLAIGDAAPRSVLGFDVVPTPHGFEMRPIPGATSHTFELEISP
jgi:mono/diheme cytochrome c family protein